MVLTCVKKAFSYKFSYILAIIVSYQIYTVVMITICENQKKNIVKIWSTQAPMLSHLKSAWFK